MCHPLCKIRQLIGISLMNVYALYFFSRTNTDEHFFPYKNHQVKTEPLYYTGIFYEHFQPNDIFEQNQFSGCRDMSV